MHNALFLLSAFSLFRTHTWHSIRCKTNRIFSVTFITAAGFSVCNAIYFWNMIHHFADLLPIRPIYMHSNTQKHANSEPVYSVFNCSSNFINNNIPIDCIHLFDRFFFSFFRIFAGTYTQEHIKRVRKEPKHKENG